MQTQDGKTMVNTNQAAVFLGLAPKTLRMWRWNDYYVLPYYKRGNKCYYDMAVLRAFIKNPEAFRPGPLPEKARKAVGHIPEAQL